MSHYSGGMLSVPMAIPDRGGSFHSLEIAVSSMTSAGERARCGSRQFFLVDSI